jgi:hypothetical protein
MKDEVKLLIEGFNNTINIWIQALEQYDLTVLSVKPSPYSWSIGQVYMHLIDDTKYYIGQIKLCVSTNNNADEEASPAAKSMFLNNGFPDEVIKGDASNYNMPQPENKEQLKRSLLNIKDEMNHLEPLILKTLFKGKTRHPGLNYFDAREWLQFAEMHFRHHLKQKRRIDDFLKTEGFS